MTKAFQPEQPARLPLNPLSKTGSMKEARERHDSQSLARPLFLHLNDQIGIYCGAFACDACTIFIQCNSKIPRIDGAT